MKPWIAAHEDVVLRFGRATIEASEWLYDPKNRTEAVQILARALKVEDKYAEATYKVWVQEVGAHPRDLKLSPAGLRKVLDNMIQLGDLKPPLPDVNAFADFTLADRAARR